MMFLHSMSAAQVNAVLFELIEQYGITNVLDALDGWTPNCQEDLDVLRQELSKHANTFSHATTTDHNHSQ